LVWRTLQNYKYAPSFFTDQIDFLFYFCHFHLADRASVIAQKNQNSRIIADSIIKINLIIPGCFKFKVGALFPGVSFEFISEFLLMLCH
jgi:hypothetical protein